jgi:hypothetical protein
LRKLRGRDITNKLMNETVLCGGELYTRKQLYDGLIADGCPPHCVAAFVFGYLKAEPQEAAATTEQEPS